jgi:transposase
MNHFAGLDISDNNVFICIVDEKGKILYETSVLTDPKIIDLTLRSADLSITAIGMETGPMSNWLTLALRKMGWNVRCFDSFKMNKLISMNVNKTDKNDARMIAEAVRINCFSPIVKMDVHIKSPGAQDLKKSIDARQALVEARIRIYHAIRGLLKGEGIQLASASPEEFCKRVREALKNVMPLLTSAIQAMLTTYIALSKEIDQLTLTLEAIAEKNEDAQRLMNFPGVGTLTALCFMAVIDDPTRFELSKSVGAYIGLTPTQYSSGKSEKQGSISKKGDKTLRALLFECAVVLLFRSKKKSDLKSWGLKKAKSIGTRKAIVAVARKLSIQMHQVFLTKKPYVEKKSKPKPKSTGHVLTTADLELLLEQSQENGCIEVAGIKQIKDLLQKKSLQSLDNQEDLREQQGLKIKK